MNLNVVFQYKIQITWILNKYCQFENKVINASKQILCELFYIKSSSHPSEEIKNI